MNQSTSLLNMNMIRCRGVLKPFLDIIDINVKNDRTINNNKMKIILKVNGKENDIYTKVDDNHIPYVDLFYCDMHCRYLYITESESIIFYEDEFIDKPSFNTVLHILTGEQANQCILKSHNISNINVTLYDSMRDSYYLYKYEDSAKYAADILNAVAFAISYKDRFEFDDFKVRDINILNVEEEKINGETRFYIKELPFVTFSSLEKACIFANTYRKEILDKIKK